MAHRRAADEAAGAVANAIPGTATHYRAWKHAVLTSPWEAGAAGFVAASLTLGVGIASFFFVSLPFVRWLTDALDVEFIRWGWGVLPTLAITLPAFHAIARGVYGLEYGAPRPDRED